MRIRLILVTAAALIVAGALVTVFVASPAGKSCSNHAITIEDNKVNPAHTGAKLCDTLTIKNLDKTSRLVAFGRHDEHVAYDGIVERLLTTGQSFTVTLNQSGNFEFHDHLDDQVQGTFSVSK